MRNLEIPERTAFFAAPKIGKNNAPSACATGVTTGDAAVVPVYEIDGRWIRTTDST